MSKQNKCYRAPFGWDIRFMSDIPAAITELAALDAEEGDHEATSRRLQSLAEAVRDLQAERIREEEIEMERLENSQFGAGA